MEIPEKKVSMVAFKLKVTTLLGGTNTDFKDAAKEGVSTILDEYVALLKAILVQEIIFDISKRVGNCKLPQTLHRLPIPHKQDPSGSPTRTYTTPIHVLTSPQT
jgi:hypothetical protein